LTHPTSLPGSTWLDPAIHLLLKGWTRGSSPRVTDGGRINFIGTCSRDGLRSFKARQLHSRIVPAGIIRVEKVKEVWAMDDNDEFAAAMLASALVQMKKGAFEFESDPIETAAMLYFDCLDAIRAERVKRVARVTS